MAALIVGRNDMRRKAFTATTLVLLLYTLGYGVARWRKFIVMKEYNTKEQGFLIRRTGPGWDVRDTWRGRLKNSLNPGAHFCFRPLCLVEDHVRGFSRPLRTTPNKPAAPSPAMPPRFQLGRLGRGVGEPDR